MNRSTWLTVLQQQRAIAVIRAPEFTVGLQMAQAAVAGGLRLIEITWTSDRPAALVNHLRASLPPDCWVGAGTVLSPAEMTEAIAAGAQFCFMPHTDPAMLKIGQTHAVPVIPGALTPTEIMTAWNLGADGVKVFPCQTLGGPAYIRHLQGPMSHIPLIPTGGITIERAPEYLRQGAIAIGVSSSLFLKNWVAKHDWASISTRSQALLKSLDEFR